jgi:hypothetical protein
MGSDTGHPTITSVIFPVNKPGVVFGFVPDSEQIRLFGATNARVCYRAVSLSRKRTRDVIELS